MSEDIKLLIDGAVIPVTNLFDEHGNEIDSWHAADRFVAGPLADGNWLSDFTDKYDARRVQ